MREIKFRFTFKDGNFIAKRYMALDELLDSNFALEQMEESINSESNIFDIEDYPDYEVFKDEYTGLKDKNGVLIFEGDIIITPYRNTNGYIYYSSPNFGLKDKIGVCVDFTWEDFNEFEVIGNIYENKELLNK